MTSDRISSRQALWIAIALVAAALAGAAAYLWLNPASPETYAVDTGAGSIPDVVPDFVIKDSNGDPRSIREWQGKSLVINFWATWCPPCVREVPLLIKLQDEWTSRGFQVIGIAVDFPEDVLTYVEKAGIDYPLLIGEQDALDAAAKLGVDAGLPSTVFTDNQSRIVATRLGELQEPDATAILDAIHAVNQGVLSLEDARKLTASVEVPPNLQPH